MLFHLKPFKFLLVFLLSYIVLQFLYAVYLQYFMPSIDPMSQWLANALTWLEPNAAATEVLNDAKVLIKVKDVPAIYIVEGCNGLSVCFTLLSFMLAYQGKVFYYLWFIPASMVLLFVANIWRVYVLIQIKLNHSSFFVFFHEYIFPVMLYVLAFACMVAWVKLTHSSTHDDEQKR